MAQQHMDRLTAVDASLLHQETGATHMHIGGVAIFAGPAPDYDEFLAHIRARLPLVPRYRQKLATPPVGLGRQRWIDDPDFNIAYHVRHTALPAPGDEECLRQLAARIFAQRLDRTKPLWEMWLVEGLAGGRFALVNKVHHALVDGISGVDMMTLLFDISEVPRDVGRDDWQARPAPTRAQLSAAAVAGLARSLATLPLRAASAAAAPRALAGRVGEAVEALADVRTALSRATSSPLNVPITPHRRVAFAAARLDDFKTVKNAFGATVNDVVLTAVAGALQRLYDFRGEPTEGVVLRACVPVSTRGKEEQGTFGNRVTQVVTPLPIGIADPLARLREIRAAMDGVKESKQAVGAELIVSAEDFAPPTILAQASRLNFSTRFFNVLVTNVPGPQLPIYALGCRLEEIYPLAFLASDRALAIAIMSYNGGVFFGLLGDYDALEDIDIVTDGLERSLGELVALARKATARPRAAGRRTRAKTKPQTKARAPATRTLAEQ